MNRRYGGRLALRGQMDFGELSSAVLVAQNAFDGARQWVSQKPIAANWQFEPKKQDILEGTSQIIFQTTIFLKFPSHSLHHFRNMSKTQSYDIPVDGRNPAPVDR